MSPVDLPSNLPLSSIVPACWQDRDLLLQEISDGELTIPAGSLQFLVPIIPEAASIWEHGSYAILAANLACGKLPALPAVGSFGVVPRYVAWGNAAPRHFLICLERGTLQAIGVTHDVAAFHEGGKTSSHKVSMSAHE